jgi:hypothetical protein
VSDINIAGLDKARIIAALYNASFPLGLGLLQPGCGQSMTVEQAEQHAARGLNFDYLQGRVMKVDLSGDAFDPGLYDRDNGQGAAARVIESLRAKASH